MWLYSLQEGVGQSPRHEAELYPNAEAIIAVGLFLYGVNLHPPRRCTNESKSQVGKNGDPISAWRPGI